jgi:hypothetical protein
MTPNLTDSPTILRESCGYRWPPNQAIRTLLTLPHDESASEGDVQKGASPVNTPPRSRQTFRLASKGDEPSFLIPQTEIV